MYPNEGKIAIIDHNEGRCGLFRLALKDASFSVIGEPETQEYGITGEISSKEKADVLVPKLGELGVRVVLIDGDLIDEDQVDPTRRIGEEVHDAIKQLYGSEIMTIGVSSTPLHGADIENIDLNDNPAAIIKRL